MHSDEGRPTDRCFCTKGILIRAYVRKVDSISSIPSQQTSRD